MSGSTNVIDSTSTPGAAGSKSFVLTAVCEPWAFSQEHPLTTSEFCKEAEKRRIPLREQQLSELWRIGALAPLVEVRNKPLNEPCPSAIPEPRLLGTSLSELRFARDQGRLADAEILGFRPQLRFFRPASMDWTRGWWNGLLYSRWQLLWLSHLQNIVRGGRWRRDGDRLKWRAPDLNDLDRQRSTAARRQAVIVAALEARYMPIIARNWINLTNADVQEWNTFANSYDPQAALQRLGLNPDELLRIADGLLFSVHRRDPLDGEWSELVRRAPQRSWKDLSGEVLVCMDHRIAAEILLRCYEDLADRGRCKSLDERQDLFYSERERLSYSSHPLDANLSGLGISPHPGVVLVVEGETEEVLVPLVRDHIKIPSQIELIQTVVMRGVGRDLTKLAAFASAPLIDRQQADAWLVVKPPTRLMVVVDPDPPFDTSEKVEAERQKILDEITAVVRSQGVDPMPADIDSFVTISTWGASCFEFAHFTNTELADALFETHPNCGGLDHSQLVSALDAHRSAGQDIKAAWNSWRPRVSKTELAKNLWPTLESKLDSAAADDKHPVPPVAKALLAAYREAGRRPHGHFVIRGSALTFEEESEKE